MNCLTPVKFSATNSGVLVIPIVTHSLSRKRLPNLQKGLLDIVIISSANDRHGLSSILGGLE